MSQTYFVLCVRCVLIRHRCRIDQQCRCAQCRFHICCWNPKFCSKFHWLENAHFTKMRTCIGGVLGELITSHDATHNATDHNQTNAKRMHGSFRKNAPKSRTKSNISLHRKHRFLFHNFGRNVKCSCYRLNCSAQTASAASQRTDWKRWRRDPSMLAVRPRPIQRQIDGPTPKESIFSTLQPRLAWAHAHHTQAHAPLVRTRHSTVQTQ